MLLLHAFHAVVVAAAAVVAAAVAVVVVARIFNVSDLIVAMGS